MKEGFSRDESEKWLLVCCEKPHDQLEEATKLKFETMAAAAKDISVRAAMAAVLSELDGSFTWKE